MAKLEHYSIQNGKCLRKGYTTGSCAAAATKAAATVLLSGNSVNLVELITPSGITLDLEIESLRINRNEISCSVRKDAGDDFDVTHGMLIFASVSLISTGFVVEGGVGIGRVTKKGLACNINEAAINPVPFKMIQKELEAVAKKFNYTGGLSAVIYAPQGEEIAKRTFNSRLGIINGISILGTSGIVEPMSEAALVATIRKEIDVRYESNPEIILITPGNYGRDFAKNEYKIDIDKGVKCSNFIGEALDYAVYCGFKQIVLMGHIGKLVKVAGGIMNTHSSVADARMEILACHMGIIGSSTNIIQQIFECITVDEVDELLINLDKNLRIELWQSISAKIKFQLEYRLANRAQIAYASFSRNGIIIQSQNLIEFIRILLKDKS